MAKSEISPRILIVDDDKAICESLADVLNASGYAADVAHTGNSALDLLAHESYDVVLLDLRLPDIRGQDLMPLIEGAAPEAEVVVITAHASLESAIQSVTHSTVGYLLKPVDMTHLLKIVERATERRRALNEVAQYREHLEKIVEERTRERDESRERLLLSERLASVGTLAAGIAHQINNPTGSILAAAEFALLTESDPGLTQRWKSAFETIVIEAKRCGLIVKNVLQFSRNETTEKWIVNLNEVVESAVGIVTPYAAQRDATLTFHPSSKPALAELSPIEIEQALVNVFRNAIESESQGVQIRAAVEQDDHGVRVCVSDNGAGIAEDSLRHVFDPFFTNRVEQGGTGLGLSIAHGIVTSHGGTIAIRRLPESGTEVAVTLPPRQ